MMLIAASCPSNSAAAVTNRTGCTGTCNFRPCSEAVTGILLRRRAAWHGHSRMLPADIL